MSEPYNNWERFYHRFILIFYGIIAGSLLPFAFVFLETLKEFPDAPLIEGMESMVIKMLLVVLAGVLIFLAQSYRKTVISEVQALSDIKEKLDLYLSKKLIQYGILAGAAVAGAGESPSMFARHRRSRSVDAAMLSDRAACASRK